MPGQLEEWTEGQTDPTYRTLPATAGGPIIVLHLYISSVINKNEYKLSHI